MDPVVQMSVRAAFALLLAAAAAHKLRDPARFRAVLRDYELLPDALLGPAAAAVAAGEALLAVALLSGLAPAASGAAVSSLMLLYAAAIGRNLARGRTDIDCGCLGPAARVSLGPGLVVRNLLLAASAMLLVLPSTGRPLLWLDAVAATAATATLVACWMATQRMLVLAPAAARMRGRIPEPARAPGSTSAAAGLRRAAP